MLLYLYETYENKSRREPICSLAFSIESNGPHCKVQYIASTWGCMVWVVYGDNGHGRREVLWADLSSYASTIRGSPWLVVRDFHAIRRHDERVEGSNEWLSWMDSLDECINQADFYDLRFWGQFFSWSNRREEGPILRKLDRALVNAEWRADSQGLKPFFCQLEYLTIPYDNQIGWTAPGEKTFRPFFTFWRITPLSYR